MNINIPELNKLIQDTNIAIDADLCYVSGQVAIDKAYYGKILLVLSLVKGVVDAQQ